MNDIERHAKLLNEMHELYVTKNADYGSSASNLYNEFGITSYLIRLSDKLNRLKGITKNGTRQVQDESVVDTLMDLGNYAILAILDITREKGDQTNNE